MILNALYSFDTALSVKLMVQFSLYFKTIYNLGTEKHRHLAKRAFDFKDIGSFAMT
jgi:hypothetical protein